MIDIQNEINQKEIIKTIQLLMGKMSQISDQSGDYLLDFDGLKVDDKSWNVWNWPQGVGLYGLFKYWEMTEDGQAYKIIDEWFEGQFVTGSPPKNVNTMAPMLCLACLYEKTQRSKYLPYLENWTNWVMNEMPRTDENGLEHITYGPENVQQMWDDTLFMTVLPLAKIGRILHKQAYIEEAKRQFMVHTKYLADRKTGLWFHGWTFLEKSNFSEALWGRGNSWITIAIPEIIDILDLQPDEGLYQFLLETLRSQVSALAKVQDKSGLWHTLLDDPNSYLETSCTAGFAYGILKSVHLGYITPDYLQNGLAAIKGLLAQIDIKGNVANVSVGTGMGPTLEYYRNVQITQMPYGQSLSILALSEFLRMYY